MGYSQWENVISRYSLSTPHLSEDDVTVNSAAYKNTQGTVG